MELCETPRIRQDLGVSLFLGSGWAIILKSLRIKFSG